MSEQCTGCGKKLNAMFGGATQAMPDKMAEAEAMGISINRDLCTFCLKEMATKAREESRAEIESIKERAIGVLNKIELSTSPPQTQNFKNKGIATAHAAIGTGPITSIASSITDLFGKESEAYNQKIQTGEELCLSRIRMRAMEMGANAIYGMHLTYTELTGGHGQVLVCANGTAIFDLSVPSYSNEYEELEFMRQEHEKKFKALGSFASQLAL